MGTRNLISVIINKELKVSQYGQWDGYPTGQGVGICKNLQDLDLSQLKENLIQCTFFEDEELKNVWDNFIEENKVGLNERELKVLEQGLVTMELSNKFDNLYPQLSRNNGANILKLIIENPLKLKNEENFKNDSLFCEYSYIIDFDKEQLEVYCGGYNDERSNFVKIYPFIEILKCSNPSKMMKALEDKLYEE